VPDTGAELAGHRVTALDGLQVSWGRDGPNEQPGPAVCDFEVIDPDAGDSFLDVVHVGSHITVYATGEIAASTQQTTYDNGSFAGLAGPVPATHAELFNATAFYSYESIALQPPATVTAPNYPGIIVPPRVFVTDGLPTAWDSIPKASINEQWRVHVYIAAQAGVSFTIGLVAYATPHAGAYQNGFAYTMPGNTGTSTGGYQTFDLTATITALPVPAWLAIRVDFGDPYIGARWNEQVGDWQSNPYTWNSNKPLGFRMYVDDFALYPPTATARRVMVFDGSASDIVITPDTATQISVKCTAADIGAELGNRVIGDDPWPAQSMITRANRIMTLAGLPLSNLTVDPPLDSLSVSYRDVDAQPSFQLLQDLAQTVGGTLWTAIHVTTGSYMWVENPANRVSVKQFSDTDGPVTITGGGNAKPLSACDILMEPVSWEQDTGDVITVVALTWQEQTTDDDGLPAPTERTIIVQDDDAISTYGTRRLSYATELTNSTDATALAERLLNSARSIGWRMDGVTLDTLAMPEEIGSIDDTTRAALFLDLLDGTIRMGYGLYLIDLPAYAPRGAVNGAYVDGGKYTYAAGGWALDLTMTPSGGQGQSATWQDMTRQNWAWRDFDSSIRWVDCFGTAVP
jgi:hypothetical protein